MLPLAFLGAVLSDHSGYYIGLSIGPKFPLTAFAEKRAKAIRKAQNMIEKYGGFAIFIGRFVTPTRSIIPLITGVSGMARAKYTLFDVMACATWTICLGLLVVGIDKIWVF